MVGTMPLPWLVALLCSLLTLGEVVFSLPSSSSSSSSSIGSSGSYPVFGTKRYARSNLIPSSDYGGQAMSLPVYHLPNVRYYDAPVPAQYFPYAPYHPPTSSDYYDDTGYYGDTSKSYYYVPQPQHRRYQRNNERYTSYGLPTYRGEYKPTPYYYAHGPSYSYTDDHEPSNPLDDLHEEMLQEDERERARDYYPVGQEQWYESPARQDSAFLRNLILYNSQLQNFGGARGRPLPPLDVSNEEDFEEYDDTEPDYEYDAPLADARSGYGSYYGNGYPSEESLGYVPSGGSSSAGRNAFSKLTSFRNSMAKNQIDEDDEEVQELKSLIHQQKGSSPGQRLSPVLMDKMSPFVLKAQQPAKAPQQYQQSEQNRQQQQLLQRQSKQQLQHLQPSQQQWQQEQQLLQQAQLQQAQLQQVQQQQKQQQLQKEQKQQQLLRTLSSDYQQAYETDNWQKDSPSYNAYDYEGDEYDDSWSHWDRKRNVQPKKATFAGKDTLASPSTTKQPKKTIASSTLAPATVKPATTSKPGNGQKEVVLPRPTNPRNLFAAQLIHAVDETRMELGSPKNTAEGSKLKEAKSSKIYDALKAMMNMRQDQEDADLRQQLEHQKQLAHIHKRFVSNEGSLVQQLDGLKRSA
ncbi:uncharacterized protein LOC128726798 [Anopheles nili]|uniref:uncharacterized protein LOC128726798 n=1 Tax=Anopheles nili TaxID=185578 RepID=UPI00237C5149|nr:uncharacterized protein LOC128726798 [Anopheles nili]